MAGAIETDPELQSEFVKRLLRVAAMGAMGGAAGRIGMGMLRDTNPTYNPPESPKPIIVNMPYRVPGPVVGVPAVDPRKEKEVKRAKVASPMPVAPVPPVPTTSAPTVDWVGRVTPPPPPIAAGQVPAIPPGVVPGAALPSGGSTKPTMVLAKQSFEFDPLGWLGRLVDKGLHYEHPGGAPGTTDPGNVPLYYAAAAPVVAGGLGLGYTAADKLLRSADRRGARKDLEDAQKEYQQAIIQRLAKSQALTHDKGANAKVHARTKQALDAAFAAVKAAQEEGGTAARLAARAFWPGFWMGPEGAAANMLLSGGLAGLGGYAGYNMARNEKDVAKVRNEIKAVDRANAEKMPAPLIARLVPVQDKEEEVDPRVRRRA